MDFGMKKKRIAILFEEDIYNQRGMFNAIRNRITYLNRIADFDIDVYAMSVYEPWYIRKLRHTKKVKKVNQVVLDETIYHVYWRPFTLTDYVLSVILHKEALISRLFYRSMINKIKGYDVISSHSYEGGALAMKIAKRDQIPFYVTWHGSDIHTNPFRNQSVFKITKEIIENATCNFFVSKYLLDKASEITNKMRKSVLYNGVSSEFVRYSDQKRSELRREFAGKDSVKIVAFAGNLIEVKNPQLLPPIFSSIIKKYKGEILFWVIGSGKLLNPISKLCETMKLPVVFWGGQPPERMPLFFNSIDVLVLPSRNEGLGLVTMEALSCGANVVGANVGGISEVVGKENVFNHGPRFVDDISNRIVYMLTNGAPQILLETFDWTKTAQIEKSFYNESLSMPIEER